MRVTLCLTGILGPELSAQLNPWCEHRWNWSKSVDERGHSVEVVLIFEYMRWKVLGTTGNVTNEDVSKY